MTADRFDVIAQRIANDAGDCACVDDEKVCHACVLVAYRPEIAAALRQVAAAERAEEREACAKMADEYAKEPQTIGCASVAMAIRARGGK